MGASEGGFCSCFGHVCLQQGYNLRIVQIPAFDEHTHHLYITVNHDLRCTDHWTHYLPGFR